MTSQKSLKNNVHINDFKRSLVDSLMFPIIALLVLFVFITVPVLKSFAKYTLVSKGLLYCFISDTSAFIGSFYLLQLGMVMCGMMTATKIFKFMLSKKQVNVYFSLGLTRTTIFLNRFFASTVTLFLSVFIPITIVLFANIAYIGVSAELVKAYLFFVSSLFICGMVGFSIAAFGINISGCMFETCLTTLTISLLPTTVQQLFEVLNVNFLKGYVMDYNRTSFGDFFSPWSFVKPIKERYFVDGNSTNLVSVDDLLAGFERRLLVDGKLPEACQADSVFFLPIIIWLGVALLIVGAALLLLNYRKTENSNSVGKFAISRAIISFTLFCNSIYIVCINLEVSLMCVVIAAVVALIVYFLAQLILTRKIKVTLKSMSVCLALEAVFIVFVISLSTGFFGIYNKLPKKENIKNVSLSIIEVDYVSNSPRNDRYVESTNSKDIDMTVELFEKIKKDSGKPNESITTVYFLITDNNGKKMNRGFQVWDWNLYTEYLEQTVNSDFFDALLEEKFIGYDKNNKSKDGQYTYINNGVEYSYSYFDDKIEDNSDISVSLFDAQMLVPPYSEDKIDTEIEIYKGDELAVALYNDLTKMSYKQLCKNDSKPSVIMGYRDSNVFNGNQKLLAKDYIFENYSYIYEEEKSESANTVIPYICVYPEMTETLAYFEANGMTLQNSYEGKVKQVLYTNCRQPISSVIGKYIENNEEKYQGTIDFDYLKQLYNFNENYFFSSGSFYEDSLEILGGFIRNETTNLDMLKTVYFDLECNLTSVDESKFDQVLSNCVPQYYTYNDDGRIVYIIYEDGSVVCQYLPQSKLSVLK